jgi:hypothetical protein
MSKNSTVKNVRSLNLAKKELINRVLKDTSSISWSKEMGVLNQVFRIFPNDLFWRSLKLSFKINSCCWFLSDSGRKFLNSEYKKFTFELQSPSFFTIDSNIDLSDLDTNAPTNVGGKQNIKNFLNLW